MTKDNRINEELARISELFLDVDANKVAILQPLIQNAAFMRITLEDLQEHIVEEGPVERYQNGNNQFGMKQSAAVQTYNSLIKNYNQVIKALAEYVPKVKTVYAAPAPWERPEPEYDEEKAFAKFQRDLEDQYARDQKAREEIERASRMQHEQWARENRVIKD